MEETAIPCHCLYSSSIPVTILGFYLEQLKEQGVFHPNMKKLEHLFELVKNDVVVNFDKIKVEDPLVIVLMSMIEPNCSFQTIMQKVNSRSECFFSQTTPKVIRNEDIDIKETIRKYWKTSPGKIVKSVDEDDIIPLIRRNSGAKTPPRLPLKI